MLISDLSLRKPVMMTMAIMSLVVLGLFSYSRLSVDLLPKIDFPIVTVVTVFPGAGPQEIETLVTKPIEEAVGSINGVKHINSTSQENISTVVIEFQMEIKTDLAAIDVREKIDSIRTTLPRDAEDPRIMKFDINASPIMNLAIFSPRPLKETQRLAEDTIKPQLERIDGVASVTLIGGEEREILVSLDKRKLDAYGLSIMQIIRILAQENLELPSGHITEERKEYTIRLTGKFDSLEQLRKVEIPTPTGSRIRLEHLGEVSDTFKEKRDLARLKGKPSVGVTIQKRADANTIKVAREVKKAITELKKRLPPDVVIDIPVDRSTFIKDSVNDVLSNMAVGILLTALVLFLFLHDLRGTFITGIVMPTSIVATFLLMYFSNFTINVMSLMGLAISIGALVANAIVVLENIHRYIDLGEEPPSAARIGTSEIALAVAASALTNVVVFLPIAFMSGLIGQFYLQFGITVTFATFFSLFMSFTLTPMMAARMLKPEREKRVSLFQRAFRKWDEFYDSLSQWYRSSLEWTLRHKSLIVVVCLFTFLGSLLFLPFIGFEFMTEPDQGLISILVEMPAGSSLTETDKKLREIEGMIERIPEVEAVYTNVGKIEGFLGTSSQGVHLGQISVKLVDREKRNRRTSQIVDYLRPQLATIPLAKIFIREARVIGGSSEAPLRIDVTGDDIDRLNLIATQIATIAKETKGTVDVDTSWRIGKPEVRVKPDRLKSAQYGLDVTQIATILRASLEGEVASTYREEDKDYDIRVKLQGTDRQYIEQIKYLSLLTPKGQVIPLGSLASVELAQGPTQISRRDRQRLITVSGGVTRRTIGEVVREIQERLKRIDLPSGFRIRFAGVVERMEETYAELYLAFILAVILTYMLLAALLESYLHPFIIMLTVPLALIGVIWSLFLTAKTISVFSLMGVVMLVGIVVNNAVLLIDYTNVLRSRGLSREEALLEACPTRLRPIIMTTVATILGMLPLALGRGRGGEMRSPMAIASIGGLMVSSLLCLYLVPVVYLLFEEWKAKLKKPVPSKLEVLPQGLVETTGDGNDDV